MPESCAPTTVSKPWEQQTSNTFEEESANGIPHWVSLQPVLEFHCGYHTLLPFREAKLQTGVNPISLSLKTDVCRKMYGRSW